jgi:hypothetical protein
MQIQDGYEEILNRVNEIILNINSYEQFKDFLMVQSKHYDLSVTNAILVNMQNPDATKLNSSAEWGKMDRLIKDDEKEKGIILSISSVDHQGIRNNRLIVYYDIDQTYGKRVLPTICERIRDKKEISANIIQAISKLMGKELTINQNMIPSSEAAGNLCDNLVKQRLAVRAFNQETRELQEQSVGFIVANHFGLRTKQYFFNQFEEWVNGRCLREIKGLLAVLQHESSKIIHKIENVMEQNLETQFGYKDYNKLSKHMNVLSKRYSGEYNEDLTSHFKTIQTNIEKKYYWYLLKDKMELISSTDLKYIETQAPHRAEFYLGRDIRIYEINVTQQTLTQITPAQMQSIIHQAKEMDRSTKIFYAFKALSNIENLFSNNTFVPANMLRNIIDHYKLQNNELEKLVLDNADLRTIKSTLCTLIKEDIIFSQYKSVPEIKYISPGIAPLLKELNLKSDKVIDIPSIRKKYKKLGLNNPDSFDFKFYKQIINGLKHAQLQHKHASPRRLKTHSINKSFDISR